MKVRISITRHICVCKRVTQLRWSRGDALPEDPARAAPIAVSCLGLGP